MRNAMKSIDHIAIVVDNIKESINHYVDNFGCSVIHCDDSWGYLQFENVKLALVLENEHPPHIAFEVDKMDNDWPIKGKLHRDGSISKYVKDPSGNAIELIEYPQKMKHFADGFHDGEWERDYTSFDQKHDWPRYDGDGKPLTPYKGEK